VQGLTFSSIIGDMNEFTAIFLILLSISTLLHLWLSRRHISHIAGSRSTVPAAFADKISLTEHQKAADYSISNEHYSNFELIFGLAILLLWTLGGGLEFLDQLYRDINLGGYWTGVAVILSMLIITTIINLPAEIYHTFVIEERFGFNKSTVSLFFGDMLKQTILSLLIATPLLWLVLWLMQNAGTLWWFYVWIVWMVFSLTMLWIYPTLIAPLFNKFTLLEDVGLVQQIEKLLNRCGFSNNGIYVMDGSRRSGHGNAYFTGFGAQKRIVFYDTLIESLSGNEIEAVLAHELGHFKKRHVMKRVISTSILSLLALALLGWLIQQSWFFSGLGVQHASNYMALILFVLIMPSFSFFLQPISAYFMRKHEFEADNFAAENSSATELIKALVKMYSENASTLTPDSLYSAFHDSHPPAPIRIAYLQSKIVN